MHICGTNETSCMFHLTRLVHQDSVPVCHPLIYPFNIPLQVKESIGLNMMDGLNWVSPAATERCMLDLLLILF